MRKQISNYFFWIIIFSSWTALLVISIELFNHRGSLRYLVPFTYTLFFQCMHEIILGRYQELSKVRNSPRDPPPLHFHSTQKKFSKVFMNHLFFSRVSRRLFQVNLSNTILNSFNSMTSLNILTSVIGGLASLLQAKEKKLINCKPILMYRLYYEFKQVTCQVSKWSTLNKKRLLWSNLKCP